ncbi:MAG TPA: DNA methyltransferase [Verrucomicrobiae bacterium]
MPHLSWNEVRDRAIRFSRNPDWVNATSERRDKQTFYNEFFEVFGIRRASVATFEANVRNLRGYESAIDLLWRGKLIVEHKSRGESLEQAETQAFGYIEDLTREGRFDEVPRFVLVSDFASFVLYDLEPEEQRDLPLFVGRPMSRLEFTLRDFPKHVRAFAFILGQTRVRLDPEDPANEKAYARMCELHDALKAGGFGGHELERLLVRILFCVFAEDTALFEPETFTRFVREQTREDGSDLGAQLNLLFDWLNNPQADNDLEDTDTLYGFRYVNGGLFSERLGFPRCNKAMRDALIDCCEFQWAKISPAVFGSIFQGVLNDRARRQIGAQYTSERDIMKVVRSLFLDELLAEFEQLKRDRSTRRRAGMEAFHQRLRSLQFLDPACGCGNFLVLTYREIRALEIEVVRELSTGVGSQQLLPIVNVDQFHGIEILEWPVRIAEVALWLMDHQMNQQASEVFGQPIDRLPLTTSPHIVQDNALRRDWNEVLPRSQCSYVLGNPPFVGKKARNAEQQNDMEIVWGELQGAGTLDYVTCWYRKAADYIRDTRIPVAFVSTNSISQGEQVGILWDFLFQQYGLIIYFAHRTFKWISDARGMAHVHVVIIGFANFDKTPKRIYDYAEGTDNATVSVAANINPYLIAANNVTLRNRARPVSNVPEAEFGSMPNDDGNLLFTDAQKVAFLAEEPQAEPLFRPFLSAHEYLHGEGRWCLWLKDANLALVSHCSKVMERIEAIRAYRLESPRAATRNLAQTPGLFGEIRVPQSRFVLIPCHSSETRVYIPFNYFEPEYIPNNSCLFLEDATLYHFGIISSGMHMAWVKAVCGRLESRYRYSNKLVYNNFPWPNPTHAQQERVDECARAVIAAREPHLPPRGMSTLANLYDPLLMPPELVRAHADLDRAVEKCYRPEQFHSDRDRVEHLFRLYEQFTAPLMPVTPRTRGRRSVTAATTPRPRRQRTPGLPGQIPPQA